MLATVHLGGGAARRVNFSQPIDISLPLRSGADNANAFGIQPPQFEPFRAGGFVGSVSEGGACNCENLFLNAHGNGTHTECVGHITRERVSINACLKEFVMLAQLVSLAPETIENGDGITDSVITAAQIRPALQHRQLQHRQTPHAPALILRTLPNTDDKRTRQHGGTNPPYLHHEATAAIVEAGIKHLLLDLPSVDREDDGGALTAHHTYWQHPAATRFDATITEMIFVPNSVPDGLYLLNLQIASLETDASPSKPVLYRLEQTVENETL